MAYTRKTQDEWHLLANYGGQYGYEVVTIEESRAEIKARLKEYQENDGYAIGFKIVKKRVKKELTQGVN